MTEKMGAVTKNITGLLPKISSLFNSCIFSDVEFVFIQDTGQTQRMYGHKLILALRSKVFASMFFDKESSREVILPASLKASFSLLLRFLYTDDIHLHTFEEAQELYELAHKYAVQELIEKCSDYISHEKLTVENVLLRYEYALKKNVRILLKDCQNFVCYHTLSVLESSYFINASAEVVEDIVKLDHLTVLTEFKVIHAVLRWGSEELKRKKVYDENSLRPCINPFMKHMRFLTLSSSEFDSILENFNILSGKESSILTRKIFQPESNVNLPECLCSIASKRTPLTQDFKQRTSNILESPLPVSSPNNIPFSSDSKQKTLNIPESSPAVSSSNKTPHFSDFQQTSLNDPESPTTQINKLSYQVKKFSPFDVKKDSSLLKLTKFRSSPSVCKSYLPSCMTLDQSRLRYYEFPLQEPQPCFKSSFVNDVKCTVTFRMLSGSICLCGFEIKVKNKTDAIEELVIDLDLKGFVKQSCSQSVKKELKNNVITVWFTEQMVLLERNKGVLEVSTDNLLLNRCSTCPNALLPYELNSGLNFACEMFLNSNRKTDSGSPFLISKLMYVIS